MFVVTVRLNKYGGWHLHRILASHGAYVQLSWRARRRPHTLHTHLHTKCRDSIWALQMPARVRINDADCDEGEGRTAHLCRDERLNSFSFWCMDKCIGCWDEYFFMFFFCSWYSCSTLQHVPCAAVVTTWRPTAYSESNDIWQHMSLVWHWLLLVLFFILFPALLIFISSATGRIVMFIILRK